MKIGVFSDVHDRIDHFDLMMFEMKKHHCDRFLFLGDGADLDTFRHMMEATEPIPFDIILGNNDFDALTIQQMATQSPHSDLLGTRAALRYADKNIFATHLPQEAIRALHTGHYDAVLYGHTHQPESEATPFGLLGNPGEIQGRSRLVTYGILDTEPLSFTIHEVPCYG